MADSEIMTADKPQHVLIVGGGIVGLCTALALATRGFSVTVAERDGAPPPGDADRAFFDWPRRGAAQFRHPHAFLGLMCNLLQDNYPELFAAFLAAGARRMDFADMLPPALARRYRPQPGDERLFVLMCRRATMETVLRRHVAQLPNVRICNGVHFDGLLTDRGAHGELLVRGVRVRRDCVADHGAEFCGDVIVDATGRMTRFPRWLASAGVDVKSDDEDAEIVYYTRHYRLRDGVAEPSGNDEIRPNGDLGYLKYGVFPGDLGSFAIIVCLHNQEQALRRCITTGDGFDTICREIPGLQPWLDPARAEAVTEPFGIGDIRSQWWHYVVDGEPLVHNFFAVGDAALRTNPLYGRGCSTGIRHAHLLADALTGSADPRQRAVQFDATTEAELRPIFVSSRSEDRAGIRRALAAISGSDQARGWFGPAFADALAAASRYNLRVLRGVMRTIHLLERPGDFLRDRWTRLIVFAYMVRGQRRNAAARHAPGPDRATMVKLAVESVASRAPPPDSHATSAEPPTAAMAPAAAMATEAR